MIRLFVHATIILFLTALTQIGGVAWMVALYVRRKFALGQPAFAVSFVTIYSILSVAVVYTAPMFGREPMRSVATESTVIAMQSPRCV